MSDVLRWKPGGARTPRARPSASPDDMPKSRPLPPLELLQALLEYQPETGWLVWKVSRSNVKAGSRAGWQSRALGYRQVGVAGQCCYEHRVAWLLSHEEDPGEQRIDHVNGDKADNRLANLRLCTHTENLRNRSGPASHGTSQVLGVRWDRRRSKWQARIGIDRKDRFVGYFQTLEEAAAARRAAELEYFGGFAPRFTA